MTQPKQLEGDACPYRLRFDCLQFWKMGFPKSFFFCSEAIPNDFLEMQRILDWLWRNLERFQYAALGN